ncbi:hypothetical protein [Acinetobacter modestus]|uniref:hypothetical protein n=1 Tax=Acinetobacter modestus TaxID=1776740 RepID=UPI001F4B14F3|nr:hypothetical protein [Acinetobacter modestus]MCH7331859.1 hypothetical protein [Acinetobacter modestus]
MSTIPISENFDLENAIAKRDKLRGKYNRSGLSNTDYKQLLELEQLIDQYSKAVLASDYMHMTLEQLQQEHAQLLLFNDDLDRRCKAYKAKSQKYQTKCWQITTLLINPIDKEMTLKAIKTVIERVGEAE